ncbi:type II secretion system F family protein [Halomonas salinarum]|uniref:type II secretion system F family protein n=1 Tax=Halomonas salinarum TaxID=1158993 RepID=UPI00143A102C|nr:type II secretion system F family protein [Halomonas salinarum]
MEHVNQLMAWFDKQIANPAVIELGFATLMGLAIFALLVALVLLIIGLSDPLRRRLRGLEAHAEVAAAGHGAGTSGIKTAAASGGGLDTWLGPMGEKLVPSEEEKQHKLAQRLRRAGMRSPGALNVFYGARMALTVLPALAVMAVLVPLTRLPISTALLIMMSVAIAGYVLPSFWLDKQFTKRTRLLRRGLPDALDLLVVCTEAGLGLAAGIQRVSHELAVSHPELSDELNLFGLQTRAGMDHRSALRDLEERTGVEDIRGLVTTLLQSMRFGTSIAGTLRIYASELREKRTQEAEEKAAKVSTKMLFPLIFCVFPSFFVVALGPPLLGAMEALARSGH